MRDCDPKEGRKVCQKELDEIKYFELPSSELKHLKFDPSIRIAQCWRKEGNLEMAIKSLDESMDTNYKHIFKGICEYKKHDDFKSLDDEFAKVIENIKTFQDVKEILKNNRKAFAMFPEDAFMFVDRILPILKRKLRKSLSMNFIDQINVLRNSLFISLYVTSKLYK